MAIVDDYAAISAECAASRRNDRRRPNQLTQQATSLRGSHRMRTTHHWRIAISATYITAVAAPLTAYETDDWYVPQRDRYICSRIERALGKRVVGRPCGPLDQVVSVPLEIRCATPSPPPAVCRNIPRVGDAMRLAQKAAHRFTPFQNHRSEPERRRDPRQKCANIAGRHVPDFDLDRRAAGAAHQAGTLAVGQRVKAVVAGGPGGLPLPGAERQQLAVERLPGKVGADNRYRQVGEGLTDAAARAAATAPRSPQAADRLPLESVRPPPRAAGHGMPAPQASRRPAARFAGNRSEPPRRPSRAG